MRVMLLMRAPSEVIDATVESSTPLNVNAHAHDISESAL